MKKILITLLVVMVAAGSMSAKDAAPAKKANAKKEYTHSIGLVGGSGIALQYKQMIRDHFTIIEEFGYGYCISQAASASGFGNYSGAINTIVLAYQNKCAEGKGIRLDYFIGGQFKVGYTGAAGMPGGLFGSGLAVGIEAKMKNAPIAFSFDFRPGYACQIFGGGGGIGIDHLFDYTFNLGVRYTLPMPKKK